MRKQKLVPATANFEKAYDRIRNILTEARNRAYQAINAAMVLAYWEIGRTVVEEEQHGAERADYGRQLVVELARRLTAEFGKGFDRSNLFHMKAFYLAYPKVDALRRELSWTHYRILLRVDKPAARAFYEAEAVNAHWSTRELERQIHALLFERLAQMYVNYYQRELTNPDQNPPIGIVLCTDKNEAVVRYTLPEGNTQIFASRSKLYLPTEAELAAELQHDVVLAGVFLVQ
jgi:hypothetical protein